MWNISVQGLVHLGVIIVVDILFHFMYILTIPNDMKLLRHLSDWALGLCCFTAIPAFSVLTTFLSFAMLITADLTAWAQTIIFSLFLILLNYLK